VIIVIITGIGFKCSIINFRVHFRYP
jgi:hypothetical protein